MAIAQTAHSWTWPGFIYQLKEKLCFQLRNVFRTCHAWEQSRVTANSSRINNWNPQSSFIQTDSIKIWQLKHTRSVEVSIIMPQSYIKLQCIPGGKIHDSLISIWINHVTLLCNYLLLVQSLFWYIIRFHGCVHLHLVETQLFQRHSFQGLSLFLLLMRNQNVLCRNCTVHFGFESYGLQSTGMSGVLKLCQDLALIST